MNLELLLIIPRFLRQAESPFVHQTTPPMAPSACRGKLTASRTLLFALIALYRSFVANSSSRCNVHQPSTMHEMLMKLASVSCRMTKSSY